MKKSLIILSFVVAMLLPLTTRAQVTCDSGSPMTVSNADTSTTTTSYMPAYCLYDYSYTEQIILADDLLGIGDIKALMYKPTNTTSSSYYDNCEIYMANVSINDLNSGFVQDLSVFELVYTGSLNWTDAGWQTIILDDPFAYDGSSNLLIAIRRNHGEWASSSSFAAYNAGASLARYVYRDDTPYTIGSISGGYTSSTVAWYKLIGCEGSGDVCYRVRDIVASNITADGMTLSWTDTLNSGASYTIYNMSDSSVIATGVTGTSYDIYYLNPNTLYTFGVVADCGTTTASFAKISARTACGGSTAVPYTEDFEGIATGDMPNCWLQLMTGNSGSGTFPSAYNYSTNARNGSVYFEFESTNGATEVAALPVMDNISSLRLRFYASMSSTYPCTLEVGVMEDTVFVPVDTVNITTFSGTSSWHGNYNLYTVFFTDYSGSGDRIAMRATGTAGSQYTLMLDDFEVGVADAPEITYLPAAMSTNINTDLVVTATVGGDPTSMVYTWSSVMADAGNATMTTAANELTINYNTTGIDTVTLIASNTSGEDTAVMIVRALDLSPITVFPYTTSFEEDDDLNWQLSNDATNMWVIGTAANNTADGTTALYISNNDGVSNAYTTNASQFSYAYRTFQFDETGEYAISFDWRGYGEGSWDYLRTWIAPVTANIESGQLPDGTTGTSAYQTTTPAGWIDLGGKKNLQSDWQNLQTTFTITTAGSYNLVFMWANDGSSGTQPPAAVDNIYINPLSCSAVASITLDSITDSEMAFHWSPVGTESEWRVVIGDTIDAIVIDTTYFIDQLSANTNYNVSVYAVCGYEDTSFATTASYRTACGAIATLPWTEDFESHNTSVAPSCWTAGFNGNPRVMTSMPHSGSKHLYFSGSTATLIALPPFSDPVNTLQVRFWTRPESFTSSSCGTFSVGYMTDIEDANSFVAVQTWSYDDFSAYEEKEVSFVAASDSAVRIAFRHNANSTIYYWYVDDVVVEAIPACSHPVSVSAIATSEDEVSVSIAGDSDADYRIYWSDGTTVDSADVNALTYTITGLTASTLYTISAATICDDGSLTSAVSTTVRTQCAGGGCDITIDMADSYGDGWNGHAINGYVNGVLTFTATIDNGSSNTLVYSMCNNDNIVLIWTAGSYPSEVSFTIENGEEVAAGGGNDYSTGDTVAVINGCPTCMKPINLVIDSVSTDQIDFHWTPTGVESSWEVTLNGTVVGTATSSSYSATGLNHSTTYQIAIRAICGAGDTSRVLYGSAMTLIMPTDVPYSTGFETGDDIAWLTANQNNGWYIGSATSCTGTNSLYISNDNGVSNTYNGEASYSYAYKLFHFSTPGTYAVSFDWKCHGEGTTYPYDYLRAFVAPATATITAGTGSSSTPTGWIPLDGDGILDLNDNWMTQAGFFNITDDTTLFVVFMWHNDASVYNQPPAAIDNIQIAELTCPWPTDITVSDISDNSATVSWTSNGSESEWSVSINGGTPVTAIDTFYTFTGLSASTNYTVSVRAVCSATDSSYATSGSFATLCGAVTLPWGEDFDDISSLSDLNCWSRYTGLYDEATQTASLTETTSGWYTTTTALDSTKHIKLNIYGSSCKYWIVTPLVNLNVPATLSFNLALTDYYDDFEIDTTDDINDDRFFVLVSSDGGTTWSPAATWGNNTSSYDYLYGSIPAHHGDSVSISLADYTGQSVFIAFYGVSTVSGGDNDLHIDNIMVTAGGAVCNAPQIVTAVAADYQATITFTSPADTNEVFIMPSPWVDPANGGIEINTSTYTFTDLEPSTQYTIGVRAVCGDNFYSEWTLHNVTTEDHPCDIPTNLTNTATTYNSASFSWVAGADETAWELHVFNTTFDSVYTADATTCTIIGLTAGISYNAAVRAMCNSTHYSEWSDTIPFTMQTCAVPTNVTVTGVTANSASVSWNTTGATKYEIEYGFSGYNQGEGTSAIVEGATSYTITGLSQNTEYDVYVRAFCSETLVSSWSDAQSFTTTQTGISDVMNSNVSLYPNPASQTVTVSGIEGEATVSIVDLNGREVYSTTANGTVTVDVTGYAQGAYFVRIAGENTVAIRKLIVK